MLILIKLTLTSLAFTLGVLAVLLSRDDYMDNRPVWLERLLNIGLAVSGTLLGAFIVMGIWSL